MGIAVRHYGIQLDGRLVATEGNGTLFFGAKLDIPIEKITANLGSPFIRLPENPPDHKIVGEIPEGKVPVAAVEMVFNDEELIDSICGKGMYRKIVRPVEIHVLELAHKLYESKSST